LQALALQQGKVGQILGGAVYWNGTVPWVRARKEGMKNDAYLCSNWVNWTELSGDHIVEQHVHNLDVANWFIGRYPRTAAPLVRARAACPATSTTSSASTSTTAMASASTASAARLAEPAASWRALPYRAVRNLGWWQDPEGRRRGLKLEGDSYTLNGNTYPIKDGNPYVIEHENLLRGLLGRSRS